MDRMIRITFLFLFLSGLAFPENGSEVEIFSFVKQINATLRWEPYREIGIIEKDKDRIVIRPGQNWIILNYKEKIPVDKIAFRNGVVYLTKDTADIISGIIEKSRTAFRVAAILIDPGHGGKDPGASGSFKVNGKFISVREKDVVLKTSIYLKELLENSFPDKRIFLTRADDTFISLNERPAMANRIALEKNEAIIYISIHANASLNKKSRGFEVWHLPAGYARKLDDTAQIKNEPEEVAPILADMLNQEYTMESVLLARKILLRLDEDFGRLTKNRGTKEETWFVVRNARMPAVLIELGFVTNKEEAMRLSRDAHLKQVSRAIYNGISDFIEYFEKSSGFTE